ncbi:hypothetical protein B0H13DRAFT_1876653 [Mycena leptocephala]|nr:hypothetical protein B0H13DRAFT_1876653 [Mycena leptocephala]
MDQDSVEQEARVDDLRFALDSPIVIRAESRLSHGQPAADGIEQIDMCPVVRLQDEDFLWAIFDSRLITDNLPVATPCPHLFPEISVVLGILRLSQKYEPKNAARTRSTARNRSGPFFSMNAIRRPLCVPFAMCTVHLELRKDTISKVNTLRGNFRGCRSDHVCTWPPFVFFDTRQNLLHRLTIAMKRRAPGKATKRQKLAATVADAAPPAADNSFAGMPLDIILLFLLFMTPAELLALRDVNKALRRMLDSGKKAAAIWVKSREYHGIPAPFEGFTERTWAQFIFGRICQECGENESREPDFGLMMRLCAQCRRNNLCQELDFSTHSDEEDFMGPILEFEVTFPHSYWYVEPNGSGGNRIAGISSPSSGKKDGGTKERRKNLISYTRRGNGGSKICDKWREDVEAEERRTKIEALTAKFKALGYQDPELNGLDRIKMLAQFSLPLTEHAWEDMRGKLEGSIKDKRRERLVQEHPDIMNGRQTLAREAYIAYVRTVSPTEATYVPSVAGLRDIPVIRAICEREPDVEVTGADFSKFPPFLRTGRDVQDSISPRRSSGAKSSMRSLGDRHVRGDEAMRHVGELCDPELDIPLSTLASALVVSLGLDPDITTVADMDRHAARFRCDGQANHSDCDKGRHTMHVFTWRGCVTHAIDKVIVLEGGPDSDKYYKNGTVNFLVFPDDVAAQAVPCHDDVPKAESTSWVCGHCTKYVGGPETLQSVTAHVNAIHGKAQPDGLDILLAPGVLSTTRSYSIQRPGAPVANSRKANNNRGFRCFRCDQPWKRFAEVGRVSQHLRANHKIINAVYDVDYGSAT